MHFVKRSNCPTYLADNHVKWTKPWVEYYRWKEEESIEDGKVTKPTDGRWRDKRIRLVLITDFKNNCGYCGESLPTPSHDIVSSEGQNTEDEVKFSSKGDVDHLIPKAIKPKLVYQWSNYIWSCKPCNQFKREFYDDQYPLLNPSNENDCASLIFIEDNGHYVLNEMCIKSSSWKKRFKNSEQKTMINSVEVCQKRRLRASILLQRFNSIAQNLTNINKLPSSPINDEVIKSLQKQVDDSLIEIKEIITAPDFYHLTQERFRILLIEHPQIKELLRD
jgi:hypothetical protein